MKKEAYTCFSLERVDPDVGFWGGGVGCELREGSAVGKPRCVGCIRQSVSPLGFPSSFLNPETSLPKRSNFDPAILEGEGPWPAPGS